MSLPAYLFPLGEWCIASHLEMLHPDQRALVLALLRILRLH